MTAAEFDHLLTLARAAETRALHAFQDTGTLRAKDLLLAVQAVSVEVERLARLDEDRRLAETETT